MTHSHDHILRLSLPMLFLVLGLALVRPDLALATDFGPDGGPGGNPFRFECPKGSYLVGFQGKAGEWIDRLQAMCAPWMHNANIFGPPTIGPPIGDSRGGRTVVGTCNDSRVKNRAIRDWLVEFLRSDNKFVARISLECITVGPPGPGRNFELGSLTPMPHFLDTALHVCPVGEVATGIHGRKGLFIDAIGLICSPFPPKAPLPFETKVNPNAMAPSPPPPSLGQPPPPSGSATTQMKRSSSMIMPRGVEETGEKGTEERTTQPEKKP